MGIPTFETTFAVPMTCEACIKDIKGSLDHLNGTARLICLQKTSELTLQ